MIFKNRNKGTWDGIEKAATMGTNFVAHTVVGLGIGYLFDYKWFPSLKPWGLLFWLIMGIVAGFRNMYRDAMKMSRSQTVDAATSSKASGEEKAGDPAQGAPDGKQGGKPGPGGSGDA